MEINTEIELLELLLGGEWIRGSEIFFRRAFCELFGFYFWLIFDNLIRGFYQLWVNYFNDAKKVTEIEREIELLELLVGDVDWGWSAVFPVVFVKTRCVCSLFCQWNDTRLAFNYYDFYKMYIKNLKNLIKKKERHLPTPFSGHLPDIRRFQFVSS